MILSILAAAALAGPGAETPAEAAADLADARCLAVFARLAAANEADPQKVQGFTSALMYYIGKIDGRSPGYDIQGNLTRLLTAPDYAAKQLPADAQRCGADVMRRGTEIGAIGEALQRLESQGSAPPR